MKIFKIAGKTLVVLVVVVLIAGFFFVRSVARKGLPDYNQTVELSGILDEVTVYRDSSGIPHIYAQNENDLYKATGYCMAQDRLWQMDLYRRVCTGRLSEIFGEDLIETDLLMRALRIPAKSLMVLERSEKIVIDALKSFADGVNQYILSRGKKLPPEFTILGYQPDLWKMEHSLYLIGYMAWDLTSSWNEEIFLEKIKNRFGAEWTEKFLPNWKFHETFVCQEMGGELAAVSLDSSLLNGNRSLLELGLEVFRGSNNWVVSGERSVTGKPFFANDMHLGLNSPGIWYQMHQVIEGELNVTGVALAGQPFVVAGHNDFIAWGFSNVSVDNMDFYLEKVNPDNSQQYELNGQWKEMEVRKVKIALKGGQEIEDELRFTHRGPIISRFHELDDAAVSMRWAGNDYSNEMRSAYFVNRARNWDEFKDAMKTFIAVSQNTNYADIEGNIGIYCCAGIPIRKDGDLNTLFPGWTDEYDWKGYVPFEELPHSFNPENGTASGANNRTIGDEYPYYISRWFALPYRIDRIREMLEEKDKLSIEDFKRMQADQKSGFAAKFKDTIGAEVKKNAGLNEIEAKALDLLSSWDGDLDKGSAAAALFEKFLSVFLRNIFLDELGSDLFQEFMSCGSITRNALHITLNERGSPWCGSDNEEGNENSFSGVVQQSFKDTVAILRADMGNNPDKWQWGKIHSLVLEHPLGSVKILDKLFKFNRGPFPVGGSYHTVCPYSYPLENTRRVTAGASHRHIYSLADWDKSQTVIPTGTSGIPASPHYCDQAKLYVNNQYHPDYISNELVVKNSEYTMVITGK